MNPLTYIDQSPRVQAMWYNGDTYDACARWVGGKRLLEMNLTESCWIVEVWDNPRTLVTMTPTEFRARYAYSRKNDTKTAVYECWEGGLDPTRTGVALGLSHTTVNKHFPKNSKINPDL